MNTSVKSQLKRKSMPIKAEPLKKSMKFETENKNTNYKLLSMKKSDLVKYCEEILQSNTVLIEENDKLIDTEKQHKMTIDNLEKTVAELKQKCANTPVYLCSECDYVAECVHDFNDHTHSIDDDDHDEEIMYFSCNFCEDSFESLSDVMEHKKIIHTSNVQHCKHFLQSLCTYGKSCWFLHSETLKNSEPNIQCNFCEQKFRTKNFLREHMKEKHINMVSDCKNKDRCKFGPKKCWFLHPQDIENAYQIAKRDSEIEIVENVK